jgi:hypothetical protein
LRAQSATADDRTLLGQHFHQPFRLQVADDFADHRARHAQLVAERALDEAFPGFEQSADDGAPHPVEGDLPERDGWAFDAKGGEILGIFCHVLM